MGPIDPTAMTPRRFIAIPAIVATSSSLVLVWLFRTGAYESTAGLTHLLGAALLLACAPGMFRRSPWSWRICLLTALVVVLIYGPFLVLNTTALFTGHPLFQDSPSTYLVVLVTSVFTLVPSLAVLLLAWVRRREIAELIRLSSTAGAA